MPSFNPDDITLYIARTQRLTFDMYQGDLVTVQALNAGDVVRMKVWDDANEDPPDLDIDSEGSSSANFTADDTTDVITSAGHGLNDGQAVRLTTTDTLPAGLSVDTTYYVRDADRAAGTFKLAETRSGAAVDITDAGTGTHTYTAGSTVTINTVGVADTTPANITIEIGQWDTADQTARTAKGEIAVVENATGRIYPYARFDVILEDSAGGAIGLD